MHALSLLTRPQICRRFAISRWTWTRWVRDGIAPAPVPLPGHPRWRRSDIDRFEIGAYRGPGKRTYFTKARQLRAEQAVAERAHEADQRRSPGTSHSLRQSVVRPEGA